MTDWRDSASCASSDPDLFFPERWGVDRTNEAKEICAGCPVREQCLDYALSRPERYGVWGGTSAKERRQMRKRRAA